MTTAHRTFLKNAPGLSAADTLPVVDPAHGPAAHVQLRAKHGAGGHAQRKDRRRKAQKRCEGVVAHIAREV